MKSAVIVSTARTPIGSFLGSLSSLSAPQLGAIAITAALKKTSLDPQSVDQVIMGQVLQGGVGQAPARQASILAGLPPRVPCTTVNKVCGSGLKALMMASDAVKLGESDIVVAGGMESMSNAPYILPTARAGFRMGNQTAVDLMLHDGLVDPYSHAHMGTFGDLCAQEFGFTRADQDAFAQESYERARDAERQGYFKDEIAPVAITVKKDVVTVDQDDEPQKFQKEKMLELRPAFQKEGTVTAANASKINDGAAAVIIMDEQRAIAEKQPVKARIIAHATFAHEPQWFTTAPVMAIKNVLHKSSMTSKDIDLFEINEAFSVVALTAMKELSLSRDQVNIFGGAVALGHPIGCSGARIVVTLFNAL